MAEAASVRPIAPRTARERVRVEITREITDTARRHLAEHGAAALSLRAVTRDLGMASSAVYRYFASRDDLLTALIIDAYDAVGAAAEVADAATRPSDFRGRWKAVTGAVRTWAVEHPHEYALVYGSPVPGYAAPGDTIGPASRAPLVLLRILEGALAVDALDPAARAKLPPSLRSGLEQSLAAAGVSIPAELMARGITVWSAVLGAISFELFGQLTNVVDDTATLFEFETDRLATLLGLP